MKNEAVILRDETEIVKALVDRTVTLGGKTLGKKHEIPVVEDGWGEREVYAVFYSCATIPALIVVENSYESAWELMVDNMPTIDEDEVQEAEEFDMCGYEFQSNAEGTGIVCTQDLHMIQVTKSPLENNSIELQILGPKGLE